MFISISCHVKHPVVSYQFWSQFISCFITCCSELHNPFRFWDWLNTSCAQPTCVQQSAISPLAQSGRWNCFTKYALIERWRILSSSRRQGSDAAGGLCEGSSFRLIQRFYVFLERMITTLGYDCSPPTFFQVGNLNIIFFQWRTLKNYILMKSECLSPEIHWKLVTGSEPFPTNSVRSAKSSPAVSTNSYGWPIGLQNA